MKERLHTLDYLRGLAALGILLFHYLSWVYGNFDTGSFFGRFGFYGVPIFYIVSGITLFHVYYDRMKPSSTDLYSFYKKRFFRIYPLLWFTTIAAMIIWKKTDWPLFFLNMTGLFGFVKWWAYFSPGVWSVGNELVFYTLFPFLVFFTKRQKLLMAITSIFLLGTFLYFAFIALPKTAYLQQWQVYTNPLNQALFFLSGFLMAKVFRNSIVHPIALLSMLFIGIGLLSFYPVEGDRIVLVTGTKRLIFSFSCLLICFVYYKFRSKLPVLFHKPLAFLGEASYSIYLLHPLIFGVFSIGFAFLANRNFFFPSPVKIIAPLIATLFVSYYSYHYFERYFIKKGR